MKQLNLNSIKKLSTEILSEQDQKQIKGGTLIVVDIIGPL